MKKSALIIFGEDFQSKRSNWWKQFDTIIASYNFEAIAKEYNIDFKNINKLVEPGSIYEASAFAEELSRLKLADGSRIAKLFTYKGYELWWMHYNSLFLYFCLPYTQYKKLLEYLKSFQSVHFYRPPYESLFSYYLQAYRCEIVILRVHGLKSPSFLPFGIFLQILITILCIPILMVRKRHIMLFVGDKFEKNRDYDFRMKFIYRELRGRNIPFVEFIRSLESWKMVLQNAFIRKRPVIYSEGVVFVGRFLGLISGGHLRAKRRFGAHTFASQTDPKTRFKLLVATQQLLVVYDDIWTIRIMKWILRVIDVRAAYITVVLERNFHAFLGCKLLSIPTIGIQHGAASKHYLISDYMREFDGEKRLSVDKYGLWSEWWKEYYVKHSKAYRQEQLFVSGPMRPIETANQNVVHNQGVHTGPIRILFISEQLAIPNEVVPYLEALLRLPSTDFILAFRFRPYRDGFRDWLAKHKPDFLERDDIIITDGELQDAIRDSDVVVGSHSTAVLEALFQYRVPILFETRKWGDYFELRDYHKGHPFFAEDPDELIEKIKNARFAPMEALKGLRERYFGDPYKNGSKWVVDQLENILLEERTIRKKR